MNLNVYMNVWKSWAWTCVNVCERMFACVNVRMNAWTKYECVSACKNVNMHMDVLMCAWTYIWMCVWMEHVHECDRVCGCEHAHECERCVSGMKADVCGRMTWRGACWRREPLSRRRPSIWFPPSIRSLHVPALSLEGGPSPSGLHSRPSYLLARCLPAACCLGTPRVLAGTVDNNSSGGV